MKEKTNLNSTVIRRIIKAIFIIAALALFLGAMIGTNLSNVRDVGATISNSFAVIFGIAGASLAATLARSLAKIKPPSKKLLIIVSISCGAGFILGTLLSGFILRIAFGLSMIVGIIGIISGIFAYIFAYGATIVTFGGSLTASAISFATSKTGMEADLRESIKKDKTGIKEVAFWHALADLEKAEREN